MPPATLPCLALRREWHSCLARAVRRDRQGAIKLSFILAPKLFTRAAGVNRMWHTTPKQVQRLNGTRGCEPASRCKHHVVKRLQRCEKRVLHLRHIPNADICRDASECVECVRCQRHHRQLRLQPWIGPVRDSPTQISAAFRNNLMLVIAMAMVDT